MIPIEGQPILTAAATRAAEERAVAAGNSLATLMDRAGAGVAEAARRLAAGAEVLVLCGPGNNGGDGWVAASTLAAAGHPVRVAQFADPATDLARAARARWTGPVESLDAAEPAPICIDALFGTGLSRPIDPAVANRLAALLRAARLGIAVDLPSGLMSDTGEAPATFPVEATLTLALGALKPAHILYPAADHCGTVRLLDIGLGLDDLPMPDVGSDRTIDRPAFAPPHSFDHKYARGLVIVLGGVMAGAGALAAEAATHAGAGYVLLFDARTPGPPHALVRRRWSREALAAVLDGKRRDRTAIVIGPGLGRDDAARDRLDAAIAADVPLVIDGDALHLLDEAAFARFAARPAHLPVVLTPHAGEFAALFGPPAGSKLDAARAAALRSGATVVFKGPDTVVAYPDGRTRTMPHACTWLSTAGTGDVLAGTIATMLASSTAHPVEAAVWLHVEAARRFGGGFTADALARALAPARSA